MVRRIRKLAIRMAGATSLLVVVALTPAVAHAGVLSCTACAACLISCLPCTYGVACPICVPLCVKCPISTP